MTTAAPEKLSWTFFGICHRRALIKRYQVLFVFLLIFVLFTIRKLLLTKRWTPDERDLDYPSIWNAFRERGLRVDTRIRSHAEILSSVKRTVTNLPLEVWEEDRLDTLYYKNKTCAPFPSFYSLKINNLYYQMLITSNGTFYLYGAYYDVRKRSSIGRSIRLIGMIDRLDPVVTTYCQVWFSGRTEPVIVQTSPYRLIWQKAWGTFPGIYYAYLITCPVPKVGDDLVPKYVSLVEKQCDAATNNLPVVYNKLVSATRKDRFGVCVKNLDVQHTDDSVRLVEWIETLRLLGARKVFFYDLQVHENMTKVLKYYEQRGDTETRPITYAGDQPNIAGLQHLYSYGSKAGVNLRRQQNILISLNDCFYRNMYRYDYLALIDTDELIMPMKQDNWNDFINVITKKAAAGSNKTYTHYSAKNALFVPDGNGSVVRYPDIPSYLYMLQHVEREEKHFHRGPKTFFDTEEAETVHNHWPISCLTKTGCHGYSIATEDAQMQHYRDELYTDYGKKPANNPRVNDTTIWRYKKELIDRSLAVLYEMKFFA